MLERGYKHPTTFARPLLLAALVVCLALFLSGCKYTDVLTQHVEDPELGVLDETAEPIYRENPDAPPDPERDNRSISDATDEDTQVEALPHYDPDALDNGPTKRLVHKDDTPEDEEAAEGDEQGGSTSAQGQGANDGSSRGTGDDLASDEADSKGDQSSSAGIGGTTVIVDDQGTAGEAAAKGTVAAVGEYATIAQMLGGAGSLVACDQHWLASLPQGVFPDELSAVQVAFAGDGTQAGQADVDALVNDIRPSVVLWDGSAPALTDEDRARLEAAGISIQAVPALGRPETEDANVMQAVIEVAAVLSDVSTTQYDVVAMRDAYLDYHRQVLEACYKANGGAYSYKASDGTNAHLYQNTPLDGFGNFTNTRTTVVYVDGWWMPGVSRSTVYQEATTSSGVIRLPHDGDSLDVSDGVALSVAASSDSYQVLDYYLQFAGLVNNAYDLAKPVPSGSPYLLVAGRASNIGLGGTFSSRSGVDSALWYNSGDSQIASNWKVLGQADFPTLLVNGQAGEDIAGRLVASAAKSDGLYNMPSPFSVVVVPAGVAGNWAYGTVESFLVAPWSLRVRDSSTLDDAAGLVADFYRYFYRCDNWSGAVSNWDRAYTAG